MKFGKRLKKQIEETLPEWRDKFVSYKDLKKLVRLISVAATAEGQFLRILDAEIDKFNAFFVEQEEDFIIRQKWLQDRIQNANANSGPAGVQPSETDYSAEMRRIRNDIVDLHGEMVLLENYSSVNYTGLAKILKKYDKRTGRVLRMPFIENVLQQPFFTTGLVSKLVRECEATMDVVFPLGATAPRRGREESVAVAVAVVAERSIFRNTIAALVTMQEMGKGSSTYNQFSLPPVTGGRDGDLLQPVPSPIPIQ